MLLIVSILILVFGLAATTRTQNITVGGYYPGVIVSTLLMFIAVRWTDYKPFLLVYIWVCDVKHCGEEKASFSIIFLLGPP